MINKLPRKIPICRTCEIQLCFGSFVTIMDGKINITDVNHEEEIVRIHKNYGHKIEYSNCMHPFLKGLTLKLSPMLFCECECDDCMLNHQRKTKEVMIP